MTRQHLLGGLRRTLCCCGAGLLLAGVTQTDLQAQDRADRITQSAAEVQQSESYGQPYERGRQDYQQGYQQDRRSFQDQGRQAYQDQRRQSYQEDRGQFGQEQYYEDDYNRQTQRERDFSRQRQARQDGSRGNRGGLGVRLQESDGRGVQVGDVYRNSPADEAGIRSGDRIVEVDGRQISSVRALQSVIGQHDPREQVEIVVLRDGRERTMNARLESRREALSQGQGRGQGQFAQSGRQQGMQQGSQQGSQQRLESRLASLEQRMQQVLSEVRSLRQQVGNQRDMPAPPRQAQRSGRMDTREDERSYQQGQSYQQGRQSPQGQRDFDSGEDTQGDRRSQDYDY